MATPIFFKNPMLALDTVRAVTGQGEDACMAMVEDGRLKFAFNLALPNTRRRLVRVFALSLLDMVRKTDSQPPNVDGVVKYILPGTSRELASSWIARHLNISPTHVHHLLDARCMEEVPQPGRKKTNDRMLVRASAVEFLRSRRLP